MYRADCEEGPLRTDRCREARLTREEGLLPLHLFYDVACGRVPELRGVSGLQDAVRIVALRHHGDVEAVAAKVGTVEGAHEGRPPVPDLDRVVPPPLTNRFSSVG